MPNQPPRHHPGFFASTADVASAQAIASAWADTQPNPERAAADERELRQREFIKSSVMLAFVGLPLSAAGLAILAGFLLAWWRGT